MKKVLSKKNMVRIVLVGFISMFFVMNLGVAFAAPVTTTSVLPETAKGLKDCQTTYNPDIAGKQAIKAALDGDPADKLGITDVLGCGIKTGNIKLYMVPYYIRFILEFVIGISGLACVGAIIFGGFSYLFAGISEDKEKGKKAILYGIIGMILTLLAWAMVNIVMSLLTM